MGMSNEQFQVCSYVEEYWHANGGVHPTRANIGKRFRLKGTQVALILNDPIVKRALTNRGIHEKATNLTPEQITAANTVLNFADSRSLSTKLADLGLTPTQWHGWLKSPAFASYLAARSEESLNENMFAAHEGLLRSAARGDTGALKLYYEVVGRYNPKAQEAQDIKLVIIKLIEAVQRVVKDPILQEQIQKEFAALLAMPAGIPAVSSATLVNQTPVARELAPTPSIEVGI